MSNSKSFYITTTLPYVNAEPHIGFAMEIIRADIIARFKKNKGFDVFFNTGTDEHGQKIWDRAMEEGIPAQEFVDKLSVSFKKLLPALSISEDINFVRTTDENHKKIAQEFWKRCKENGFIYKKHYNAKYCVGCELEKTDSDLVDGKCPVHPNREIELKAEENYFFRFSQFQEKLLELYEKNPDFLVPAFRLKEIKTFVESGLEDFSISRIKEKMSWGVPVPDDENHVMYVWFDALVNYISVLGWPEDENKFSSYWVNGTPVQYCGKDNIRQQSAMWQAMLMSVGLPNSRHIVIDGFITAEGGIKMSKSLGNVVSPIEYVEKYGAEALRYFLAREIQSFEDSPFTKERFELSYNSGLANGIGNLVSRIMTLASKHLESPVDISNSKKIDGVDESFEHFDIKQASDTIWTKIGEMDKRIQEEEPFKLIKEDKEKGIFIIKELVEDLLSVALAIYPIMPKTSEIIVDLIKNNKAPESPIFPRI